jgi:cytidylate kinase
MSFIVAIDGTAGTGKGTITKLIAKELGLINVDTGAIYRCVTLATINKNYSLEDKQKIIDLVDELDIKIQNDNGEQTIFLNGEDVTKEIRKEQVTNMVSELSSIPEVRLKVTDIERSFAKDADIIMEGRDITTYVFPQADVKIYLDATPEERAKRRVRQNEEMGIHIAYEDVLESINKRDKNDKEKEIGALKIAEDAIVIDTTGMSVEEEKNRVMEIIMKKYRK